MTHDEATYKYCPQMSRAGAVVKCLGDGCMMWEPYDYWINARGVICNPQREQCVEHVVGGDCGLKSKQP